MSAGPAGAAPDTPASIARALAGAREASAMLARRSLRERLDALGALLEALRTPGHAARERLERALPGATGFSPGMVAEGLAVGLAPWTPQAWRALGDEELGDAPTAGRAPAATAVVLAGALPTPTILQLLAPLAVGSALVVKPSAHDPVTPQVVRDTLAAIDPDLGAAIGIVHYPRQDAACRSALCSAPCVVVTGGDEAVATHRAATPPDRHFVASGHRFSVALLDARQRSDAWLAEACQRLARDVVLWEQLGCLSPVALFVRGVDAVPEAVAHALAAALGELDRALPRGRIGLEARAALAQARDEAELRAAAGEAGSVRVTPGGAVLVVERDCRLRASPLHRFLRVHPAPDDAAVLAALSPARAHLAGVALAGVEAGAALPQALARLGASRVCPAGEMQAPPLGWRREGRPVLASLLPVQGG